MCVCLCDVTPCSHCQLSHRLSTYLGILHPQSGSRDEMSVYRDETIREENIELIACVLTKTTAFILRYSSSKTYALHKNCLRGRYQEEKHEMSLLGRHFLYLVYSLFALNDPFYKSRTLW